MKLKSILTHPGGAHKDDFLACCLLMAECPAPIERREPEASDMEDPHIAVVDVGGKHEPALANFDHHQFPKDHPPACSLSLVLEYLGLYQDALVFCDWLETTEWLDTRGPLETSRWLGIGRDTLAKLNSPIDVTLLRRFAAVSRLDPGQPLWEIMRWIGQDLISYLRDLRTRLDFIQNNAEFWDIDTELGPFRVLFMPRTQPLPDDPSAGLGRFIESHHEVGKIAGLVYPDRRGAGYGLSRHNDHARLDFTRIESQADVHFAHARGFVAKTSATDPARLRQLLRESWV